MFHAHARYCIGFSLGGQNMVFREGEIQNTALMEMKCEIGAE
jgi:hypothetical protein